MSEDYDRSNLDSQLKTELLTALQPAFAKISEMGIRYSALPGHTVELADALNEALSAKWRDLRGIEVVSFGVSSVTANEEDEKMIKEMQRNAAFMDPTRTGLDLQLRPERHHRQLLPQLRQAGSGERERVDVQLRREEHGQILLRVRQARARGRVDVRLRYREQGQILLQLRQALRRLR